MSTVLALATPAATTVSHINTVLENTLADINQCFLHARMLKHMGFMRLADHTYKVSIDEMRHADQLVERILFLGGKPAMQELAQLHVGQTVEEMLQGDVAMKTRAHSTLSSAIRTATEATDHSTAELLQRIQAREEEHLQFLHTQLNLIETMGLSAYLQTQVHGGTV